MTIPTTNLSFSHIQTEFPTGANPVSISEYYRGGTYVPTGTATSATDGTPISTSGLIRVGMFRGVTKAVPAIRPTVMDKFFIVPSYEANAYDTTASTVDTTSYMQSYLPYYDTSWKTGGVYIFRGMSGGSAISGTLNVRYSYQWSLVDVAGGGQVQIKLSYSLTGGPPYTEFVSVFPLSDGGDTVTPTTFSVPLTVDPALIRVHVAQIGTNWAGTFSELKIYDVVFIPS